MILSFKNYSEHSFEKSIRIYDISNSVLCTHITVSNIVMGELRRGLRKTDKNIDRFHNERYVLRTFGLNGTRYRANNPFIVIIIFPIIIFLI